MAVYVSYSSVRKGPLCALVYIKSAGGRVCYVCALPVIGKPRPSWSAIGCVRAIRSDGRLAKHFFCSFFSFFPLFFTSFCRFYPRLSLFLPGVHCCCCFFSTIYPVGPLFFPCWRDAYLKEERERPSRSFFGSPVSLFFYLREPLKKRNKSTWDINQVRQPCRGSLSCLLFFSSSSLFSVWIERTPCIYVAPCPRTFELGASSLFWCAR